MSTETHTVEQTASSDFPSARQVIEALDPLRLAAPPGWSGVIGRLWDDAQWVLGLRLAHDALDDIGTDAGQVVRLSTLAAGSTVWGMWWTAVRRFAVRAQAALDALAAGQTPASDFDLLPGERAVPPFRDQAPDHVPCPDLTWQDLAEHRMFPAPFRHLPLAAMRIGWARLCHAAQAAQDRYELGAWEDEETGRVEDVVPEHMLDQAEQMEAEADTAYEALSDYAYAVAWTLATDLRDHILGSASPAQVGHG